MATQEADFVMCHADDFVMYFVVNADLRMGPGKMAAQVAHAAIDVYMRTFNTTETKLWSSGSHAKVILTAPEAKLLELHRAHRESILIEDEGRTQVESGSRTVLVFPPRRRGHYGGLSDLKLHK